MKQGKKQRVLFERSAQNLKRMRYRYAKLILSVIKDLDMNTLYYLAERLQDRGFYSSNSATKDVMFSFMRYLYKLDCRADYGKVVHLFQRDFRSWIEFRGFKLPCNYNRRAA